MTHLLANACRKISGAHLPPNVDPHYNTDNINVCRVLRDTSPTIKPNQLEPRARSHLSTYLSTNGSWPGKNHPWSWSALKFLYMRTLTTWFHQESSSRRYRRKLPSYGSGWSRERQSCALLDATDEASSRTTRPCPYKRRGPFASGTLGPKVSSMIDSKRYHQHPEGKG